MQGKINSMIKKKKGDMIIREKEMLLWGGWSEKASLRR